VVYAVRYVFSSDTFLVTDEGASHNAADRDRRGPTGQLGRSTPLASRRGCTPREKDPADVRSDLACATTRYL